MWPDGTSSLRQLVCLPSESVDIVTTETHRVHSCVSVASRPVNCMRSPRRRPLVHLRLIVKRHNNWCFDGVQTLGAAPLMASASRRQPPPATANRVDDSVARRRPSLSFFVRACVCVRARHAPLSCCHRLTIVFDKITAAIVIHAIISASPLSSQQLGLFHFPSSPSSPSSLPPPSLPSSSPADDTYHPLFICLSHFVTPALISSRLVTFRIFCRLAESGIFPSRSERERERDRRRPRGQRLHQQQLRRRRHPRAFLRPHLCRPGILSLQAAVRCKTKKSKKQTLAFCMSTFKVGYLSSDVVQVSLSFFFISEPDFMWSYALPQPEESRNACEYTVSHFQRLTSRRGSSQDSLALLVGSSKA